MTTQIKNRIKLEKKIARKIVTTLIKNGYFLNIYNGDNCHGFNQLRKNSNNVSEIMKVMQETDEDYIMVYHGVSNIGWVKLVYGNDGWDVVNDYTTNLEDIMTPILDWCDTFQL